MIIFKHAADLTSFIKRQKKRDLLVGFVPTMGALHRGHISLVKESIKKNDITICSIFVNPLQFNNAMDFKKYPITIENDILLLEENGCPILFLPDVSEIYPKGTAKIKSSAIGKLENILEGAFRPGHFAGVYAVVSRLLEIVKPDYLYLGQKDYQQYLVIKNMADRKFRKIKVISRPIIREKTGLALSSRNRRLNETEIVTASELNKSLEFIKTHISNLNWQLIKKQQINILEQKGFKVEYLEIANRQTLETALNFDSKKQWILLVAAWLAEVRLIDNTFL
ncbi:MAG: pantoate--beta-alanine ligase [Ginsengibacter sp.]